MEDLRQLFDRFDSDGSGAIEVSELDALLDALGLDTATDEALVALTALRTADPSQVTWAELAKWWDSAATLALRKPEGDVPDEDALRHLFDRFDSDGDGSIDVQEFGALLGAAGLSPDSDRVVAAIQGVDRDHDASLSWSEFLQWWRQLTS